MLPARLDRYWANNRSEIQTMIEELPEHFAASKVAPAAALMRQRRTTGMIASMEAEREIELEDDTVIIGNGWQQA